MTQQIECVSRKRQYDRPCQSRAARGGTGAPRRGSNMGIVRENYGVFQPNGWAEVKVATLMVCRIRNLAPSGAAFNSASSVRAGGVAAAAPRGWAVGRLPRGPPAMQCLICLSDEGEVVQKGCHCRGDAGAVHVDCLIELATHAADTRGDWQHWEVCSTCLSPFNGKAAVRLARAFVAKVSDLDRDDPLRTQALIYLACETSTTEAETIFTEVLEIQTRTHGPSHRETLWTAHLLAGTYQAHGRYTEALALQEATVTTMEEVLDPDDKALLSARCDLGRCFRYTGNVEAGLAILVGLLEARKRTTGPEHPDTINVMDELASAYRDSGRIADAIAISTEILALRRRVSGKAHATTLYSMNSLSILHMKQEQYAEAEAIAREVVTLQVEVDGEGHPHVTTTRHNVGLYALLDGRPAEGEPILRAALEVAMETDGFDVMLIHFFSASLGLAHTRLGRHDEAVAILRETHQKQLANGSLGSEHPSTLRTACFLGEALVAQGQVDEGRAVLEETLAIQTRVLGIDVYDTRETAARLAGCKLPAAAAD